MEFTQIDIILLIAAYLLGSVPFGLIIAKCKKIDIRSQGSGNIGATNVTRVIGKKLGALVLMLDLLKAVLAVLLAREFTSSFEITALCGAICVLGHIFPIWLKFKGGKGVASTLGVLLAISPIIGIAAILTWMLAFKLFKISSLSALIAMISLPIWAGILYLTGQIPYLTLPYLCGFLGAIVIATHHENIARLLKGNERKIK